MIGTEEQRNWIKQVIETIQEQKKTEEEKQMMPVECVGCIYEKNSDLTPLCVICSRYHQEQGGDYEDFYKTLETKWQDEGTEPRQKTTRTDILETAIKMVNGSRDHDHGEPENNFEIIANLWSLYIGTELCSEDVAIMMILLKVARIASGKYNPDNYVDIAGYASCAGEIAEEERI